MKNSIYFDWQEKVVMASLNNINVCEIAIKHLPFLFYKKPNLDISTFSKTIEHFDETTQFVFVKNFRILMCVMYRRTIIKNNKITHQEELFCVDCDHKVTPDFQICAIDNTYKENLNTFWETLLLSFLNNPNTPIRCEVIKDIPMIINHLNLNSSFRKQMLMLINDKDEEVRIYCSKILNYIIFKKDSSGSIEMVESFFPQMLNILSSTANTSLKYGNIELQYTCLETIFNVGW